MTPEQMAADTSELRAAIGRDVVSALTRAGAQRVEGVGLTLWFVEDFLSADDCAFLIDCIDCDRRPSPILSDAPDAAFRTSETCNLDRWDERIHAIDGRILALTGLAERHGETLQGQRYAPGQYFRPHQDFFHIDQAYWRDQEQAGGQRTWTAMTFLNRPESGGDTAFTHAGLSVRPKPGLLLMWDNMDANGAPNPYSTHEGAPVTAGVKYIVTKWFRERIWL